MSRIVLDASAILFLLNNEAGSDELTAELLSEAVCSTVNLAEVHRKLVSVGADPDEAWEDAVSPIRDVEAFTPEHARIAGGLVIQTQALGLSLGDRACLALGIALEAPIYTADRSWMKLKLGIRIHSLR